MAIVFVVVWPMPIEVGVGVSVPDSDGVNVVKGMASVVGVYVTIVFVCVIFDVITGVGVGLVVFVIFVVKEPGYVQLSVFIGLLVLKPEVVSIC